MCCILYDSELYISRDKQTLLHRYDKLYRLFFLFLDSLNVTSKTRTGKGATTGRENVILHITTVCIKGYYIHVETHIGSTAPPFLGYVGIFACKHIRVYTAYVSQHVYDMRYLSYAYKGVRIHTKQNNNEKL